MLRNWIEGTRPENETGCQLYGGTSHHESRHEGAGQGGRNDPGLNQKREKIRAIIRHATRAPVRARLSFVGRRVLAGMHNDKNDLQEDTATF